MITKNAGGSSNDFFKFYLLMILAAVILIHLFSGCSGCNKSTPTRIDVVDDIIQKSQPKHDSLIAVISAQNTRITELEAKLYQSKQSTASAKKEVVSAKQKTTAAFESGDTLAIVTTQKELIKEQEDVIREQDQQLSIQGQIIQSQDSVIATSYAQTELQQTKFKELATAYDVLGQKLSKTENDLTKAKKKLKRSKAINRIAVPLAGAAVTSIVAPQYTLPAAAVAVAIYIISKPKKEKQ